MTTGTTAYADYETENICERKAGGAITRGTCLKLDTTEGQVVVTTAITDVVFGIALDTVASGEKVRVQKRGVAKVLISAAVALGAQVMPGANGKCATAAGATAISFGVAESQGDTDAQLIRVDLIRSVNGPANS